MRSISGYAPAPTPTRGSGTRPGRLATPLLVTVLLASFLGSPGARAETLEDAQARLDDKAVQVQESLEFVDSSLVATASRLAGLQARKPAAEQAVSAAESRVAAAVAEVDAVTRRIAVAEQSLAELGRELEQGRKNMAANRKMVGRIAADAYRRGGVPQELDIIFGSGDLAETVDSIGHSEQALKAQNAALAGLSEKAALDTNSQTRQAAVREEIADLKQKAEAALAAEKTARNEAAGAKKDLDLLIASTDATARDLAAKKPRIQAELASVKAAQQSIAEEIAERQRREREAWLAEQARARAAEQARAEAAARAAQQTQQAAQPPAGQQAAPPMPPVAPAPPPVPAPGNPSSFGISAPFGADVPITSGFGWRATPPGTIDFLGTGSYLHAGIDFGASCGTPVYASAAGTVTTAGWTNGGGGHTVMVSHGVVQGNALTTVLYHNSSIAVSVGQRVAKGQLIAYTGSSGNSTGCHAHFETWLNGSAVDPMGLL